jgi:hypothetical protein
LSHTTSEQPARKPAASQYPLSASVPWNFVADGYAKTPRHLKPSSGIAITSWASVDQSPAMQTMFVELRAIMSVRGVPARGRPWLYGAYAPTAHAQPVEPSSENMGEELWREKEKLALASLEEILPMLKKPLTSDAWLGVGVK